MSCIVSYASDLFTFGLNEIQDEKNLHQIKSKSMQAESKYIIFGEIISRDWVEWNADRELRPP